jgi:hypothetical protein
MNTTSIDFKAFVEWDNSPFILFDEKGHILYLNQSAEILFGYVTTDELYRLALNHASHSFGYKTTMLPLIYDLFHFYAITVGYENETQLSLRLYHMPRVQSQTPIDPDRLTETDINLLLEANITLFQSHSESRLELFTDPDLPRLKIDQNRFSTLLRKTLECCKETSTLRIDLKLLVGEHIIINGEKKPIAQLAIHADRRSQTHDRELEQLATECHIAAHIHPNQIKFEIPLL